MSLQNIIIKTFRISDKKLDRFTLQQYCLSFQGTMITWRLERTSFIVTSVMTLLQQSFSPHSQSSSLHVSGQWHYTTLRRHTHRGLVWSGDVTLHYVTSLIGRRFNKNVKICFLKHYFDLPSFPQMTSALRPLCDLISWKVLGLSVTSNTFK